MKENDMTVKEAKPGEIVTVRGKRVKAKRRFSSEGCREHCVFRRFVGRLSRLGFTGGAYCCEAPAGLLCDAEGRTDGVAVYFVEIAKND